MTQHGPEDEHERAAFERGADAAIAAVEEMVQRGFVRKRERAGQFEYQMLRPDDYVCPQCGGGWAGIAGRECENCALLIELLGAEP